MEGKDNGKRGDGGQLLGRLQTTATPNATAKSTTPQRGGAAEDLQRLTTDAQRKLDRLEAAARDLGGVSAELTFGAPSSLEQAVRELAERPMPTKARWICEPRCTVHLGTDGWHMTLARWGIPTPISRELAAQLVGEAYARALPKRDGLHPWTIAREAELGALEAACADAARVEGVAMGRILRGKVKR